LIAFRVTDEEYSHIEKSALAHDVDPNTWCRNVIVTESLEGFGLTKTQRLLYEEIARTRYLMSHGFKLLFESKGSPEVWKKLRNDADKYADVIANDLLSRRNNQQATF
jgi:triphosphoribosyl-dephospho-CoA synthetase